MTESDSKKRHSAAGRARLSRLAYQIKGSTIVYIGGRVFGLIPLWLWLKIPDDLCRRIYLWDMIRDAYLDPRTAGKPWADRWLWQRQRRYYSMLDHDRFWRDTEPEEP